MLIISTQNKSRGFSLIELLVGISIISILLTLATPSFQTWIQNTQIRTAAESIQSGLQKARAEAVTRNTNVEFVLGVNSGWVVQVTPAEDLDGDGVRDVIDTRSANDGSKDVIRTVINPGATTVTFNNFGGVAAANADGSDILTQVELDSAALTAADSRELRVTIGVGGNARMCDPNAPAGRPTAC